MRRAWRYAAGSLSLVVCAGALAFGRPGVRVEAAGSSKKPNQRGPLARKAVPKKVVIPPGAGPVISTTAMDREGRAAETRLAQFIRALQQGRRLRAVQFLSSRVTPQERQALVQKRWLRKDTTRKDDITQVLFQQDLQIRTREIYQDGRKLYVVPRTIPWPPKKTNRAIGYLGITMRLERGKWWVEMHPSTS
jgi:hypothetical protein